MQVLNTCNNKHDITYLNDRNVYITLLCITLLRLLTRLRTTFRYVMPCIMIYTKSHSCFCVMGAYDYKLNLCVCNTT